MHVVGVHPTPATPPNPLNLSRMARKRLKGWGKSFVSSERAGSEEVVISGHVFPGHNPEDVSLPLPLTLSLSDRDQVAVLLLEENIELAPSLMKRHEAASCATLACLAIKRPPLPRSKVEQPPRAPPPVHPREESPPAYDEPPPPYSEEPPPAHNYTARDSFSVSTGGRSRRRPSRAPPLPPGHFTAEITPGFDVPKETNSAYSSVQSSNDVPSQIFTENSDTSSR